eukprot:TRINITY_DN90495_c0_g1_i1.p1 TRINITY_DN90495_c0_g1~~TRINITY_DN90495_c0_g1_i1.p1  ORF type:complete len:291 (-),score=39.72 TRINITY_DN90495_c0_g1_i1:20-805(-)
MAYQATIGATPTAIPVKKIRLVDLVHAVEEGITDFRDKPTHLYFLAVIYPVATLFAFMVVNNDRLIPLVFPIMAGLVLIGPFIGLAMEEMSRHREKGLDMSWAHAFNFFEHPAFKDVALLGLLNIVLFLGWVAAANTVFVMTMGDGWSTTAVDFTTRALTTSEGWMMIVVGNALGFMFAVVALALGVISFPILLDKNCGLGTAVVTSVRAVMTNPIPMAAWGLFVGVSLVLGAIPLLVGLAVVVPVLGHATWHLYRKMVAA